MQAQDAVGSGRRRGDRGHRQGARVRGEDRGGGRAGIERSEDRLLEVEVLERGLDHEVGLGGDRLHRRRGAESQDLGFHPVVHRVAVQAGLPRPSRQAIVHPGDGPLDGHRVNVVQEDLVATLERDLRDPRAHRPRADDPDGRHTGFIASNGWRQSRQ